MLLLHRISTHHWAACRTALRTLRGHWHFTAPNIVSDHRPHRVLRVSAGSLNTTNAESGLLRTPSVKVRLRIPPQQPPQSVPPPPQAQHRAAQHHQQQQTSHQQQPLVVKHQQQLQHSEQQASRLHQPLKQEQHPSPQPLPGSQHPQQQPAHEPAVRQQQQQQQLHVVQQPAPAHQPLIHQQQQLHAAQQQPPEQPPQQPPDVPRPRPPPLSPTAMSPRRASRATAAAAERITRRRTSCGAAAPQTRRRPTPRSRRYALSLISSSQALRRRPAVLGVAALVGICVLSVNTIAHLPMMPVRMTFWVGWHGKAIASAWVFVYLARPGLKTGVAVSAWQPQVICS